MMIMIMVMSLITEIVNMMMMDDDDDKGIRLFLPG